ncbi:39S ribosomal protein L33, mitochondrial [Arapaima gigas]
MFLTAVNLAKAKSKRLLVEMASAAGTGYSFTAKRNRLKEKLVMRKLDPVEKKDSIALNRDRVIAVLNIVEIPLLRIK